MARFNVCARRVLRTQHVEKSGKAFIDFHWCVESFSRLRGESFESVMGRLGSEHGFGREPDSFPTTAQLALATQDLKKERENFLTQYAELTAQRRQEKRGGRRHKQLKELDKLEARRAAHNEVAPRVGYFGWRARRKAAQPAT